MKRRVQSIVVLALAVVQIATARLMVGLGIGEPVEVQSALVSHPLVPYKTAFVIWGLIYAYALIAAIWQVLPRQKESAALETVDWNFIVVWLVNSLWQLWVPLIGLEWISFCLIVVAVFAGLNGLLKLRHELKLSRKEKLLVAGPLALVTGWLTAACVVNFTSAMIWTGFGLDAGNTAVSVIFLIALIAFGGWMVYRTGNSLYAAGLAWALFWVLIANQSRDHEPAMVAVAAIGLALVVGIRVYLLWRKPQALAA
ncbi:hypothetical protein [Asticcacaulis taihuensis]|uniref:hypothetical protein n=1 Tax=Asticcacaulis taihuensis TaxID=260084 RepID=UPI0026F08B7A|nr:hypothetical protein [Asticcacaulis taihuensis]